MKINHLILLPGLDGTGRLFAPFLKLASLNFKLTVIDYPTHTKLGYRELRSLLQKSLPVNQPYAILAESFSGPLAIDLASSLPPKLSAIILCNSFIKNPLPKVLHWLRMLVTPFWFQLPAPQAALKLFLLGLDCPDELIAQTELTIRSVSPEVISYRIREVMNIDVWRELRSIRIPILYLAGRQDRLIGDRGWKEIAKLRDDVMIAPIDAPHFLLQREPAKAIEEILKFLEKVDCDLTEVAPE